MCGGITLEQVAGQSGAGTGPRQRQAVMGLPQSTPAAMAPLKTSLTLETDFVLYTYETFIR